MSLILCPATLVSLRSTSRVFHTTQRSSYLEGDGDGDVPPPPHPPGCPCPPAGCSPLGLAGGDVDGGARGAEAGGEDVHPHLHLALHRGAGGHWYQHPLSPVPPPVPRCPQCPCHLPPASPLGLGSLSPQGSPYPPQHPTKSPVSQLCPRCLFMAQGPHLTPVPVSLSVPVTPGSLLCSPASLYVLKSPSPLGPSPPVSPSPQGPHRLSCFSTPPCPGAPVTSGSLSPQGAHHPRRHPSVPAVLVSPPAPARAGCCCRASASRGARGRGDRRGARAGPGAPGVPRGAGARGGRSLQGRALAPPQGAP